MTLHQAIVIPPSSVSPCHFPYHKKPSCVPIYLSKIYGLRTFRGLASLQKGEGICLHAQVTQHQVFES